MGSLAYFSILTTIYMIIRYFIQNTPRNTAIWFMIYMALLLIGMYAFNLSITKEMCGVPQAGKAILVTTVPWIIIFGLLVILLTAFPGWLSPFSNTFGYLVTRMAGISTLMDKLLVPKVEAKTKEMRAASEALQQIYADKGLLINEITMSNFDQFWQQMTSAKLFVAGAGQYKEALRKLVKLKTLIAEYIWAMLAGTMITSVSKNYIINTQCRLSAEEMEARANQYERNEAEKNDDKPRKIYNVRN